MNQTIDVYLSSRALTSGSYAVTDSGFRARKGCGSAATPGLVLLEKRWNHHR